jgi:Zn-finger protein
MLKRLNRACKFFPCHTGLEDCTFCYCPFYPCLDKKKGKFIHSSKSKNDIWSCESCNWIHKRKVIEKIFNWIRKMNITRQNLKNDKVGIIILSHGSKLNTANANLDKTLRVIKQKTGFDAIVPAHLQFHQPSLEKSVKTLIAKGRQTVIIIPFFLLNGNHVTRDIPHMIEKERSRYPKVDFIYTKNLGKDARIADIVSDMVEEAVHSVNHY